MLDPVLGGYEPFNQILAIEALSSLGDEGRTYLRKVVEESGDSLLRGYALEYLVRLGQDNKFVYEIASGAYPIVVRVQAMKGLIRNVTTRESSWEKNTPPAGSQSLASPSVPATVVNVGSGVNCAFR